MANRFFFSVIIIFLGLMITTNALAQESFGVGARAMGVGGQWTTQDDATSAYVNPAALIGVDKGATLSLGSFHRFDHGKLETDFELSERPIEYFGITLDTEDPDWAVSFYSANPYVNEKRHLWVARDRAGHWCGINKIEQHMYRIGGGGAYKIADWLYIGAGLSISWSKAKVEIIHDLLGVSTQPNQKMSRTEEEWSLGGDIGFVLDLSEKKKDGVEIKIGGAYHIGDFLKEGFEKETVGVATFSNDDLVGWYDWPNTGNIGGHVTFDLWQGQPLTLVFNVEFLEWSEANKYLDDTINLSGGFETPLAKFMGASFMIRGGYRKIESPYESDPVLSEVIDFDDMNQFTVGCGIKIPTATETVKENGKTKTVTKSYWDINVGAYYIDEDDTWGVKVEIIWSW